MNKEIWGEKTQVSSYVKVKRRKYVGPREERGIGRYRRTCSGAKTVKEEWERQRRKRSDSKVEGRSVGARLEV